MKNMISHSNQHKTWFCLVNIYVSNTDSVLFLCCRIRLEDVGRLSMLLKMGVADLVNSVSHSGHQYAMRHSASNLSEANRLKEVLAVVSYALHILSSYIKLIYNLSCCLMYNIYCCGYKKKTVSIAGNMMVRIVAFY